MLCLFSSMAQPFDTGSGWLGNGYMPACELDRVDTGDSTDGEKYERAACSSGVIIAAGNAVATVNGGPLGTAMVSGNGNLGGATRFGSGTAVVLPMPAVVFNLRLEDEAFLLEEYPEKSAGGGDPTNVLSSSS